MWPFGMLRAPETPLPPTQDDAMRRAFATPTKGRPMPERITYTAVCVCGFLDAKWTVIQGTADKANLPIIIECPTCDPQPVEAAA